MRKTIAFLLAFLAGVWATPIGAVGTIPGISFSQQFDSNTPANPLGGGLLYLIQAGTTSTPQNCFKDTAMTLPYPNPVVLDAFGRVPQLFCADGQIKVRLTDKNGISILTQDNLLIVGASSGGGGGGSVDPTTVLTTGDFKMQYGTGPISGFVRCNGRTIGSATSGATERANLDTQALYTYLWGIDPNLAVTGGRGASGLADFNANKPMALPDCRGRALAGLGDMGNTATSVLTSTYAGCTPTTLGAGCGGQSYQIQYVNLPPLTPSGSVTTSTTTTTTIPSNLAGGNNPYIFTPGGCCVGNGGSSSGATGYNIAGANMNSASSSSSSFSGNQMVPGGGTDTPFAIVSPMILTTIFIKL